MINLMLVEDNNIVRQGLIRYFARERDIRITAAATDARSALQNLQVGTAVDVVMADWNMPDMDGMELTSRIIRQFPNVAVIILTMHSKTEYKDKAKAAGAKGYILKDGEFDALTEAVRKVARGEEVYS